MSQGLARSESTTAEVGPPLWLAHLERAHDWLRRAGRLLEACDAPTIDLRPAARTIEAAHGHLYAAIDLRDDRVNATHQGVASLDEGVAALERVGPADDSIGSALACLRHARTGCMAALERLAVLVPTLPATAPDLRGNAEGVPRLIAQGRESLVPEIRVPVPEAPPEEPEPPPELAPPGSFTELEKRFEELRRRQEERRRARKEQEDAKRDASHAPGDGLPELPPGFASGFRPAITELAFVHDKTRECFEEVAMLGTQRAPLLGDPWRSSIVLEQRLLACIDAIAAMGPRAVARIEPLVVDSPAKDPSRLFGIAMVLGCFDGRDALAAAERVCLGMLEDPACAAAFAAALGLVPHPMLPLALRTLLSHSEAAHRAVAIEVLGYRGIATVEELARAARDEPRVARAALPHYALTADPGVRDAVDTAAEAQDDALREAAWLAMMLSGHPHAAGTFSRELAAAGPRADAAALGLALVGDERDAAKLLEVTLAAPTPALVGAVGWAGAAASIPPLMGLLRNKSRELREAAAYALDRITGAGMYEEAEVAVEEIDVPEAPDPKLPDADERRPLSGMVDDPRDPPEPPAPETIERPTIDTTRWRDFWRERSGDYDPKRRYRRGHAYTPLISLRELDGVWPATPAERRRLQHELIIRTGSFVRTDVNDFVVVQEQAIKAWESIAVSASGSPGAWVLPRRR